MSYSYSAPSVYGPTNSMYEYQTEPKKNSSLSVGIGGAVVGGASAAYISHTISPFVKSDGKARTSFARKALNAWAEKSGDALKASHKQGAEILKKIDNVKTVEGLKKLLNENSIAALHVSEEQTVEGFLKTITENNLANNKKTIKETLVAIKNTREQNMKNWIEASWNKSKKAFEKTETVTKDAFDAITESAKGMKWKTNVKWGAIGAIATGLITYIGHKLYTNYKNSVPKQ